MATWTIIQFCKGQYTTFGNYFHKYNYYYMFVKFKQFIFQKLHPLMSSDLSKTKISSWRHAKNVIFMVLQWSKANFFLSRLWITIHFLKGLCMTLMIKLVKHKWRSLQTRTLLGSHDSWSRGLCPYDCTHVTIIKYTTTTNNTTQNRFNQILIWCGSALTTVVLFISYLNEKYLYV